MISDARRGHVSPGIYTEEKDVTYSVKSLGITSLGLAGETLYGPAFENIEIENWGEFVDYFGGTSPEKFKGTGLPKYELPYIAKSYLEESRRLNVVRVLGLSGYEAGKAWVVKFGDKPVVVLRSVMTYDSSATDACEGINEDVTELVESVEVGPYTPKAYDSVCNKTRTSGDTIGKSFRFSLTAKTITDETFVYNISLSSRDNDYIYKVLSTSPEHSLEPLYIDAVYEGNLEGLDSLTNSATCASGGVESDSIYAIYEKKNLKSVSGDSFEWTWEEVGRSTSSANTVSGRVEDLNTTSGETSGETKISIKVGDKTLSNYKEMYRPAITPWFVSEVGVNQLDENEPSAATYTISRLFRFFTISDGDSANYQVKVSIQNINPSDGTFDVVVRDFNDEDRAPMILEKFPKCTMVEGDASYIAYKIGTIDGGYESRSKYIAVEMSDSMKDLSSHIPAGFLGYPIPFYGESSSPVTVKYSTEILRGQKPKRIYFGLNKDVIEPDILSYKGKEYYADDLFISNGFHLDCRLSDVPAEKIYIDGYQGNYTFTTVKRASASNIHHDKYEPIFISADATVKYSLYKDAATRKFTAYFYGGFDGWDVNRIYNGEGRSNTDDFKASRYIVGDKSSVFEKIESVIDRYHDNGLNFPLSLPSTAITSDYYAYLAGYKVFANPQDIDINVFATPGIDWDRNYLLTEEALDVIEDADDGRGGDALYIMASPRDLDVAEVVPQFEDTDLDSSYAATYYPWVMYYDSSNRRYIELPVTKDVVRNIAQTDNDSYPWFAPAGTQRGDVKCIKALHKTTLAEEDALYEARINPVKSFAQDGVKIWGNKTAYTRESPLNRINVRRLMIRVKKLIADAAKHLIFEQYDDTLEKQFRGLVEPILADVKANRGIYDYRVQTEVTPETRDQHILPAKILIKPTPSLEYISISFVVYPQSVDFSEN